MFVWSCFMCKNFKQRTAKTNFHSTELCQKVLLKPCIKQWRTIGTQATRNLLNNTCCWYVWIREWRKDKHLHTREKNVREHVCFTSTCLDTFLCNPADMMIFMKIIRVGCSFLLCVSSPCRLSYRSCATSVFAVWSASSLASVLVQASCSIL